MDALKRSSSAPVIHRDSAMNLTSPSEPSAREASPNFNLFSNTVRTRRFSTSSPGSIARLAPRISQLRQEECLDAGHREVAHEKEVHSAMAISQSWEDLTIEAAGLSFKDNEKLERLEKIEKIEQNDRFDKEENGIQRRALTNSLSLSLVGSNVSNQYSCPSPTGTAVRQCYSPVWKNNLSPSPTRKAFATRRSLSPIAIRPSSLGSVKRKFELDEPLSQPPAKRTSTLITSTSRQEIVSSPQRDSPMDGENSVETNGEHG